MISKELMRDDFIKVDKEDTISRLLGRFRVSKKTEAVVLDGKKYAGIVSKRKMLKSRLKVDEEKIKHIMIKPAVLDGTESAERTAALLYTSDVHMLPVVVKGALRGAVYAIDVLKSLSAGIAEKKVSDVSRGKVTAFDQHTEIGKAMHVMRLNRIDRAPIVTKDNKLSGMISVIDLMMKYEIFPPKRVGGKNIRQSLSSPGKERDILRLPVINDAVFDVVTARGGDNLSDVIKLMDKNKISDVVVLDEYNQPSGIVTIKDLLKLF